MEKNACHLYYIALPPTNPLKSYKKNANSLAAFQFIREIPCIYNANSLSSYSQIHDINEKRKIWKQVAATHTQKHIKTFEILTYTVLYNRIRQRINTKNQCTVTDLILSRHNIFTCTFQWFQISFYFFVLWTVKKKIRGNPDMKIALDFESKWGKIQRNEMTTS